MKRSFLTWAMLLALTSSFLLVSCSDDDDDMDTTTPNIVEYAQNDPNFSILVDAVVRAGLADALSGTDQLTLFAPNNTAFEAFLTANNFNSVDDIPVDVLQSVLLYHVVGGANLSTSLSSGYLPTLAPTNFGTNLNLFINTAGGVSINTNSQVIAADVEVANGVIHVVNQVIAPADIVTLALSNPAFSSLVAALTANGLNTDFVAALTAPGPFTVFAPTNAAFQALLDSNPAWNALTDIPTDVLETVLLYHVTGAGNVTSSDLTDDMPVNTLADQSFSIDLSGSTPQIIAGQNTANIIEVDVQATNGVIHAIDSVILP